MAKTTSTVIATNRQARHNYNISDTLEAGIELFGSEVKSLRAGSASISEAFISFENRQAYLVGAHIPIYPQAGRDNHEPLRKRRLLMSRKQIADWGQGTDAKGYSVVPLKLYFKGPWVKLQIGLGKGRKDYDKRHKIKEQDQKREIQRVFRR